MEPFHQPDDIGHAPKAISPSAAATGVVVTIKVVTRVPLLDWTAVPANEPRADRHNELLLFVWDSRFFSAAGLKIMDLDSNQRFTSNSQVVTFACKPKCVFSPSTLTSAAKLGLVNVPTSQSPCDGHQQARFKWLISFGTSHCCKPEGNQNTDLWPSGRRQSRISLGGGCF